MVSFFSVENFKSPEEVIESFNGIKNFRTVMVSFFSIKIFKSPKKVLFSVLKTLSGKAVVEFF